MSSSFPGRFSDQHEARILGATRETEARGRFLQPAALEIFQKRAQLIQARGASRKFASAHHVGRGFERGLRRRLRQRSLGPL